MLAAGVFVYGALLGAQGLAALILPRRIFLRLSGYLQLAAICLTLACFRRQLMNDGIRGPEQTTIAASAEAVKNAAVSQLSRRGWAVNSDGPFHVVFVRPRSAGMQIFSRTRHSEWYRRHKLRAVHQKLVCFLR